MRWLIVLLVATLVLSDLLGTGMSLGPGLSVKNAILYCLAVALAARLILSDSRLDMPVMLVAFAVLISYAILSWLAAGLLIRYPRYDLVPTAINLKSSLVDSALFFFAALYALRTSADVRLVLRALALALTVANLATLTDLAGLTDFGVRIGARGAEAGRVFGIFGHANETAGVTVCLLPAVVAFAFASRGVARLGWGLAVLISLSVLIMTVSRGAFVAAGLGSILAIYVCRRVVPVASIARGAAIAGVVIVVSFLFVGILNPSSGNILEERLLGQSTSLDMYDVSSGRTAMWSSVVERMAGTPLSFITGFGWDAYEVMPFRYATHNHYLGVWFELGIPGLAAFVFILVYLIVTARKALDAPDIGLRPHLIAFLFGMLSLMVAIFFGNQNNTWPYVWIYAGVAMRAALLTLASERSAVSSTRGRAPIRPFAGEPVTMRRPRQG
jgi:O-antigen ligase